MQHTRRRIAAVAAIVAVAAAIPAAGLGGQPVIRDHGSFVDGPNSSNFCGVPGTDIVTGTFTFTQDASGSFHAHEVIKGVFTAAATDRALEFSSADTAMGAGVDNGDGTVTFTEQDVGLVLKFQIPNGPVLKDADGKPIIGAGELRSIVTFDIATGDLISIEETWHGPHPFRDGVDICGPATAYLTS
jgi:hypothetical protein